MIRQSGFALFAPLLLGAFGAAGWLLNQTPTRLSDAPRQARALATAREALIARAANDANRPGSLPCPDQSMDSAGWANHPGDGRADMLVGNHCPSYLGRLPWITLDLPQPRDRALETLWYVAAPGLRDDNSAEPVTPATPTGLSHAGHAEVAALLIAPGTPLAQQQRPSSRPDDYLEGWLDNGPARTYWNNAAAGNDQILIIYRDELMAAAMTRVAQMLRHCLQSHGASSGRFPWPAPLAAATAEGRQDTRFGRIPQSQPEDSAEKRLAELRARHRDAIAALAAAGSTAERQTALTRLAASNTWIANRLHSHRQVAASLGERSQATAEALSELAEKINRVLSSGKLPTSDGAAIRRAATATQPLLATLAETLPRYGLDALAWDALSTGKPLPSEGLPLVLSTTMAALQQRSSEFASLDSAQPRPPVEQLLAAAAAILPPLAANLDLARLIAAHGRALDEEASAPQLSQQSIAAAARVLAGLRPQPGTKQQQLAAQALTSAIADARQLASALDAITSLNGAQAASAWPMVWAADACAFLTDESGWWQRNAWHDTLFYQVSDPLNPQARNLSIDGKTGRALAVIAAGRPLQGQNRPSTRVEDYLEGANAAASRNGEALAPSPAFSTGQGNDRIAY